METTISSEAPELLVLLQSSPYRSSHGLLHFRWPSPASWHPTCCSNGGRRRRNPGFCSLRRPPTFPARSCWAWGGFRLWRRRRIIGIPGFGWASAGARRRQNSAGWKRCLGLRGTATATARWSIWARPKVIVLDEKELPSGLHLVQVMRKQG